MPLLYIYIYIYIYTHTYIYIYIYIIYTHMQLRAKPPDAVEIGQDRVTDRDLSNLLITIQCFGSSQRGV